MITEEQTLYAGEMNSYDADHDAAPDWGVTVVKSADNSRITIHFRDPHGANQEIAVEIAGEAPQVIAFSELSDEPLLVAKIGHAEAYVSRNTQDPSGYDYIRIDEMGMNRANDIHLTPGTPEVTLSNRG